MKKIPRTASFKPHGMLSSGLWQRKLMLGFWYGKLLWSLLLPR